MNWIRLQGVWINLDNVVTIFPNDEKDTIGIEFTDGEKVRYKYNVKNYLGTKEYLREILNETTCELA